MYEINIKVNADGTLTFKDVILKLGTKQEKSRTSLLFELDESIEGTYYYVKFIHAEASYLYRVSTASKMLIIPSEILQYSGRWFFSFIASNNFVSNSSIFGTYAYISEVYEAVVNDGILDINKMPIEIQEFSELLTGTLNSLHVPTSVTEIGEFTLANYPLTLMLYFHDDVRYIRAHAFQDASILHVFFGESPTLISIGDYAFMRTTILQSFRVPKSVNSWGKYAFQNSSIKELTFDDNSSIMFFPTYSFYYLNEITSLSIPKGTYGFNGNGQTISHCDKLKTLYLPNSFNLVVQATHVRDNESLDTIILEKDWNVSANFSNCLFLTASSIVEMFRALKNLTGQSAKSITLGEDNLAKVTSSDIQIATSKNWTVG